MSRFVNIILNKEGGDTRLITANEEGKPAWFVLKLDPLRYKEYKSAFRNERMNIIDYGQILASGWGNINQSLIANLKQKFPIAC
jgi:hypothetical protein